MKDECRICKKENKKIFSAKLLKYEVNYYECNNCGYVQTENPYWINEAYSDIINKSDTGIMNRNINNSKIVCATLIILGKTKEVVVDYAGGYGILVRLLRDIGIDAYWLDKYCANLVAKGCEYKNQKAILVTAFEVFEHFEEPMNEIKNMLKIAPNILFSTEIIPEPTPKIKDWWYYGSEHGQHIGFYRINTFEKIAKENNKYYLNLENYHIFSEKKISKFKYKIALKIVKLNIAKYLYKFKPKTWLDHISFIAKTNDNK